jgi:hypothetical protein
VDGKNARFTRPRSRADWGWSSTWRRARAWPFSARSGSQRRRWIEQSRVDSGTEASFGKSRRRMKVEARGSGGEGLVLDSIIPPPRSIDYLQLFSRCAFARRFPPYLSVACMQFHDSCRSTTTRAGTASFARGVSARCDGYDLEPYGAQIACTQPLDDVTLAPGEGRLPPHTSQACTSTT